MNGNPGQPPLVGTGAHTIPSRKVYRGGTAVRSPQSSHAPSKTVGVQHAGEEGVSVPVVQKRATSQVHTAIQDGAETPLPAMSNVQCIYGPTLPVAPSAGERGSTALCWLESPKTKQRPPPLSRGSSKMTAGRHGEAQALLTPDEVEIRTNGMEMPEASYQ